MARSGSWVRMVNYIFMLLFLIAAGLQYNDIDAAVWISTYGAAAVCCILWRWKPVKPFWYIALAAICLVWAISTLWTHAGQLSWDGMFNSIQMKNHSIEIIREAGGLFVITIWMGVLSVFSSPK